MTTTRDQAATPAPERSLLADDEVIIAVEATRELADQKAALAARQGYRVRVEPSPFSGNVVVYGATRRNPHGQEAA